MSGRIQQSQVFGGKSIFTPLSKSGKGKGGNSEGISVLCILVGNEYSTNRIQSIPLTLLTGIAKKELKHFTLWP